MSKNIIYITLGLLVIVAGSFFYFNDVSNKDSGSDMASMSNAEKNQMTATTSGVMMTHSGSYQLYSPEKIALASKGPLVLFFRASWCPTCRGLDSDIKSHLESIPENLTILDVDYDMYGDLKKKYAVTYQHTLVQVNQNGEMLKKWSGSPTLYELLTHIK